MKNLALVLGIAALGFPLAGCFDPPAAGTVVLDIDVLRASTQISSVDFSVGGAAVFAQGAGGGDFDRCAFDGAVTVPITAPILVHIDATKIGRMQIGGLTVPAGDLAEIRLLVDAITVHLADGGVRSARAVLSCGDDDEHGDAGRHGVLRLRASGKIQIAQEQSIEAALLFDPARDIELAGIDLDDAKKQGDGHDARDAGRDPRPGDDAGDDPGKSGEPQDDEDAGAGDPHAATEATLASRFVLVTVPPDQMSAFVANQLIVRFADSTAQATIDAAIAAQHAVIVTLWKAKNYYSLRFPAGSDMNAVRQYYDQLPSMSFSLPDLRLFSFDTIPNDPHWPQQTQQWSQIQAPKAWDVTTGSYAPVVAVVDTGIDLTDPDLIGNLYINPAEVPVGDPRCPNPSQLRRCDGTPIERWQDLDVDGDGVLTFKDLNDPRNACVCSLDPVGHPAVPHRHSDEFPQCDPLDLVDGKGTIGYGWQDGCDADSNGLVDDIVGWNFNDGNNLPQHDMRRLGPVDQNLGPLHGTWTATVIGAEGNNQFGSAGVAWRVRIAPLRIDSAGTDAIYMSTAIAALHYAGSFADVINLSSGTQISPLAECTASNGTPVGAAHGSFGVDSIKYAFFTPLLQRQFDDIDLGRALLVNAAGNAACNLDDPLITQWPGSFNQRGLRVAGVDASDALWFTPGPGGHSTAYGVTGTDIAAPSTGFFFAVLGATVRLQDGTSFAAPLVSGVAALVRSQHPSFTACEIANRILSTADSLPGLHGLVGQGVRLNAFGAVDPARPVRGGSGRLCP